MDADDRKFALRMIPYGVFVVTAVDPVSGEAAAATVHWVTQTSFTPCLIAVSIKAHTPLLALIRATNRFGLHMLGKEDQAEAFSFYRPAFLEGSLDSGQAVMGGWGVSWGRRGTMLLHNAVAAVECETRAVLEAGDHHPVIAEVVDVHARLPPDGRPDEMMLLQRDLGPTIFYGG
jgi:flavin reductase (DIM6/NTAB) family NADH-FMN oxidoreductase RutF